LQAMSDKSASDLATSRVRVSVAVCVLVAVGCQALHRFGDAGQNATETALAVAAATLALSAPLVFRGRYRELALLGAFAITMIAVEYVGTNTGFPFGNYKYSSLLQPQLASVPVVVGLAWLVGGILAIGAARFALGASPKPRMRLLRAVFCGWSLMAWDIALDPHMIREGYWKWFDTDFFRTVPAQNFVAWFVIGTCVGAILDHSVQWAGMPIRNYAVSYVWLIVSSVLAFLTFLDDATVALACLVAASPSLIAIGAAFVRTRPTYLASETQAAS